MGPMCRYADDLIPMLKAIAGPKAHELGLDEKVDLSKLKVYTVHESHFPLLTSTPVNTELMERKKQVCNFLEERFGATVRDARIKSFRHSLLIMLSMPDFTVNTLSSYLYHFSKKEKMINPFVELFKSFLGCSKYHWATMFVLALEYLHYLFSKTASMYFQIGVQMREEIQELLGNDGILLYPTYPHTALSHQRCFLAPLNFSFSGIFNAINLPVTQCPLGLNRDGLPLGIQIVAGTNNEKLSLAVAKQLENEYGGWKEWYPGKLSDRKPNQLDP